jgi:DNA-binding MarR family transcriptional regulator
MATTDAKQAPHYAPTAGVLLLKVGKAAERRFAEALKPIGLTPRHLGVLFEVQACPTSQQALIEMVGVDPSKLVGLLNDLEADGLIVRKRDPEDRRRHIVEVSAKGSARLEDAKKVATTVEEELLAGLDAGQRAELLALLAQVADSSGIFEGCVERLKLL